ncbi:DNA-binding protein [Streptomyces xiamenensis]|uniref:DNA-binding protein n=1 Tax=Streptomyces xiamenensis TaxID=408015 RepID=UPI0035D97547
MSTQSSPHLTVGQLAERWQTTPRAIYCLRQRGRTPDAIKAGRILLFPIDRVEAHEAAALREDAEKRKLPPVEAKAA